VRQDIPPLSYRLPLLLWLTYWDPSSPVLFLLLSLSPTLLFLRYGLTFFQLFSFFSPGPSSKLVPLCWLSFPFFLLSCSVTLYFFHFFFSLVHPIYTCLISRLTFFSLLLEHKKAKQKKPEGGRHQGVGESENTCHLLSPMGIILLKV